MIWEGVQVSGLEAQGLGYVCMNSYFNHRYICQLIVQQSVQAGKGISIKTLKPALSKNIICWDKKRGSFHNYTVRQKISALLLEVQRIFEDGGGRTSETVEKITKPNAF